MDQETRRALDDIRSEIATLRRANRRVKRSAGLLCAILVGALSIAASSISTRMTWSTFLSRKAKPHRKQVVTQPLGEVIQAAAIQTLNNDGQQVGFIGTDTAGDGLIVLGDVTGLPQAVVSVDTDRAGQFTAFNGEGTETTIMGVDSFGDGFIGVGNTAGGLTATIGVGTSAGGFLGVANSEGTGGARMGVDTTNVGHPAISNESGIAIWASDDVPTVSASPGDPRVSLATSTTTVTLTSATSWCSRRTSAVR